MHRDAPTPTDTRAVRPARGPARALRGLFVIALVALLYAARPLLLPVAIAVLFTFVLSPPVRALHRRGMSEYVGAGLVVGALLVTLGLLFWLVAAPAAVWWQRAPATVGLLLDTAQRWRSAVWTPTVPPPARVIAPAASAAAATPVMPATAATAPAGVASAAPPAPDPIGDQLASEGVAFTRIALGETVAFALSASAALMLLYFLLASERWLVDRTVAALPTLRRRRLLLTGLREAQRDIGLFIRTMSLVNVALGAATGVALAAIGLPHAVLWATTTALLAFVPYLGPALIAVLLMLAGSATFGTGPAMLAPPAAFLALHAVEANFLSPLIMGHRLRIAPLFVFGAVLALGWLWGVAGAFIAVPLLLGLRTVCRRVPGGALVCAYLDGGAPDDAHDHLAYRV